MDFARTIQTYPACAALRTKHTFSYLYNTYRPCHYNTVFNRIVKHKDKHYLEKKKNEFKSRWRLQLPNRYLCLWYLSMTGEESVGLVDELEASFCDKECD